MLEELSSRNLKKEYLQRTANIVNVVSNREIFCKSIYLKIFN